MTIETMAREFRYDGVRLPDPNPKLSIEEVRTAFSATVNCAGAERRFAGQFQKTEYLLDFRESRTAH